MSFQRIDRFKANQSTFNNVTGYQSNTTNLTFILPSHEASTPRHRLGYPLQAASRGAIPPLPFGFFDNVRSLVDLITSTIKSLRGSSTPINDEGLILELESLLETVGPVVVTLASIFQANNDVINAIGHLAARCRSVVEQVHEWARGRKCAWGWWSVKADVEKWRMELGSFRKDIVKLLELSSSYARLLLALDTRLDMLITLSFSIRLRDFEGVPSVRRNQVTTPTPHSMGYTHANGVELIDALGKSTILPLEFCVTPKVYSIFPLTVILGIVDIPMQKFHAFLRALFVDRPGQQFVERGAYDLTCDEGKQIIRAEEWHTFVKVGTAMRMSMIVRRSKTAKSKECPVCCRSNLGVEASHGWVEWYGS
jgi:hypothetical protein